MNYVSPLAITITFCHQMSCCSHFVLWALRSLCYCICQIKPSKPCKWKYNLVSFIVTGCTHINSFIGISAPDLLLLGPHRLNRMSRREKHLFLGGIFIYIHQWQMSLAEATLEKSEITLFIIFLACPYGSIEIMGFFIKEKDLIGCIFSKLVDLNLFKNSGGFSLSFTEQN